MGQLLWHRLNRAQPLIVHPDLPANQLRNTYRVMSIIPARTLILVGLLFVVIITGCQVKPESIMNAAALKVAGSFITEHAHSSLNFRVKGSSAIKKEGKNVFYVTGSAEGFSSYNVPFAIDHFSETVRYSGGDIDDIKNWECLEMYVGKKRIK